MEMGLPLNPKKFDFSKVPLHWHDLVAIFYSRKFNYDSIIDVFQTMTYLNIAWGNHITNFIEYFQHFRFYILVRDITRNANNFQTIPSWVLGIFSALSFHINYPFDKKCVDLLDYIDSWLKLNKTFVKLTNFLQSISVHNVVCFTLIFKW